MSTYQSYDFIKDIEFHINNKNPINLKNKSEIFKQYLFSLKIFQLSDRIKNNDPIFNELYCIFVLQNNVFVSKKIQTDPLKFDYVEITNGIVFIRRLKMKKIFK